MAGTPTPQTRLIDRLTLDSSLVAHLTGGIWNRPISRDGRGGTPGAFGDGGHVRPCAVVLDIDETETAFGPPQSFDGFTTIFLYAPRNQTGKDQIAIAWDMIRSRLHDWNLPMPNGTGARVKAAGRLRTMDDPDDDRRAMGGIRLQITGLWVRTE